MADEFTNVFILTDETGVPHAVAVTVNKETGAIANVDTTIVGL